jgi:large subunit ribosomal protein L18e
MKGKRDEWAVVVGTVTDDKRLLECPVINVVALRVTDSARKRIMKAGGHIKTFDELVLENPTGSGCFLLQGRKDREAKRHFGGAAGIPHSGVKPYLRSKSKRNEIKNN